MGQIQIDELQIVDGGVQVKKIMIDMIDKFKSKLLVKLNEWRRGRSLYKNVQEEKKTTPKIKKIVAQDIKPLWFSAWEATIVVALFIFFLLLTHAQTLFPYEKFISFIEWLYPFQGSPFALTDGNHYQNLIAIHAGIGAVLIGLAFFIAQEIAKERDKGNSYKGFIILRRSKFFSLLLAEILFFFLFLWGSVNILSTIPVFFMGICTLYSLYKTFGLIIDDFELKKEERKIFFDKLNTSFLKVLDLEITKLIGDNQLRKLMKDYENFIEVTPFSPINKQDYTSLKAEKSGVFTDLNLRTLKKLLTKLQESAPLEKEMVGMSSEAPDTLSGPRKKDPYCYLSPRFFSDTKEVNDILFWIRNDLFTNEKNAKEIRALAQQAFTITSLDFDLEHARNDIRKLKLLSLDLIKDQRSDELGEVLNNYTKLIEDFYSYLEPYGGGFSEKQARDMSMEIFFGGLKPVAWISEDIREIFEHGIESNSKEIIKEVGYLPVRLMRYSIDYKDHLIFQQFQYYPFRLYQASVNAQKTGKDELAIFLFDRSWRYLKEISDYYLEPKLKKEEDYPTEEVRNFACAILKIFQGLLKSSFDARDIESFKTYLSTTNGLFRHLDITDRFKNEEAQQIADFLKNKKEEIIFGLASWIFYKFSQSSTDEIAKQFYNAIQGATSSKIEELTNVFLRSHSFETEDFWGWDNWEMTEKGEDQVHSIQILEKLERFYAVKALSFLASKTNEEIEKIELPHSRDIAYLAEGTRDLTKVLDDIKTNPDNWKFVLQQNAINKVDPFKSLLAKAKEKQEQDELKLKREQNISQKRVEEFKKEVLKTYYEGTNLRDIFAKYFKTYEDKTKEKITGKKERFGINIVDDKASFFDEWHVHYVGWGENYGRDLASGENSFLLDDIAKDCKEITKKDFEATLSKFENPDDIVIFATNIAFWRFFEDSKNFKPKWHRDIKQLEIKGFGGWYDFNGQSIPVFETYHQKIDKQILILNKSKAGQLVQLSPLNDKEDEKSVEDIFYMDIQAFSENTELTEEFIKKPPEWLQKIGDEQKQREHLQERVRIQIFERFEYNKLTDFEGYKLTLKDD